MIPADGFLLFREHRHADQVAGIAKPEHIPQPLNVSGSAAGGQAQWTPALDGARQHRHGGLVETAALERFLADQVITRSDLQLGLVIGQID